MDISYSFSSLVFSSAIGDIDVNTSKIITLELYDEDEAETFFSTNYSPYSNRVIIRNLRDIIEEWMEFHGLASMLLSIRISDGDNEESIETNVIYCSQIINESASNFIPKSFLTTLSSKITYPHCDELLSFIGQKEEAFIINWSFVIEYSNGTLSTISRSQDEGVMFGFSLHRIDCSLDMARQQLPKAIRYNKILMYSVSIGQRSFRFFVHDEGTPQVHMVFRNIFGAFEYIHTYGTTTEKIEASQSSAFCNHIVTYYDRNVTKTYEVKTAPLPLSLAQWMEQLFCSYEVRKVETSGLEYDDHPLILFGDHTCEVADGDEELNTLKFEWQYVEDRPHIDVGIFSSSGGRIFTNEFNEVFS